MESIIENTYSSENLPSLDNAQDDEPVEGGRKEEFGFQCPYNYGLMNKPDILQGTVYNP